MGIKHEKIFVGSEVKERAKYSNIIGTGGDDSYALVTTENGKIISGLREENGKDSAEKDEKKAKEERKKREIIK